MVVVDASGAGGARHEAGWNQAFHTRLEEGIIDVVHQTSSDAASLVECLPVLRTW